MKHLVLFGGSGFVGQTLIPHLARAGWHITVPSRNPDQHPQARLLPNTRLIPARVHSPTELHHLLQGADATINLIGILNESGRDGRGFEQAHTAFTEKLIAACQANGVRRLLQMSALNAGRGQSHYLRTRGEAEARVKASGLDWTIFQPSVIFGPGDGLFTRFANLLRWLPVLPLARAQARFAPVYVGDVAQAITRALDNPASHGQTYELYGPDVMSLAQIVRQTAHSMGLRRLVLPLPDALARVQGAVFDFVPGKPFSSDNYKSLRLDSVGGIDGLYRLGIDKTPINAIVPQQLGGDPRQQRYDAWRRARTP